MLLYKSENVKPLLRFLLDICRNSLHLGLRVYLTLFSTAQDNLPECVDKSKQLADEAKWATIYSNKDFDMSSVVRMYAQFQQDKTRSIVPRTATPDQISFGKSGNDSPQPSSSSLVAAAAATTNSHEEIPANSDLIGDFNAEKYHQLKKLFLVPHQTPIAYGLPTVPIQQQGADYSSFSIFNELATRGIDTALEKVAATYTGDSLAIYTRNAQRVVDRATSLNLKSSPSEWKSLFQEVRDLEDSKDLLKSSPPPFHFNSSNF